MFGIDLSGAAEWIGDTATNAWEWVQDNSAALATISFGAAQIALGYVIDAGGIAGGAAITGATAGIGTAGGVAVAGVAISAGTALTATGTATIAAGLAMMSSGKSDGEFREKTTGANANDKQQVDNVANQAGIDRRKFGDFIEETKQAEGRGPSDNYTYKELQQLAKEFKEML